MSVGCVVMTASFCLGFGSIGHRTVADIAQSRLSEKARQEIAELLDGENIVTMSTYADEIRSDGKYKFSYPWHYVNFPEKKRYEESKKSKDGDLVTSYEKCVEMLKSDTASVETKRFYLSFLVHNVADAHQPMHVGRKRDKGGNDIKVTWFGQETNLHRVWDSNLIDAYGMSYSELALNMPKLSPDVYAEWESSDYLDWIHESKALSSVVYESAKRGEDLKYRYSYVYFPMVREQLHKAGIRLAKVLNELFE